MVDYSFCMGLTLTFDLHGFEFLIFQQNVTATRIVKNMVFDQEKSITILWETKKIPGLERKMTRESVFTAMWPVCLPQAPPSGGC